MRTDYGTATHREILAGMQTATELARTIRAVPNPAVQHMILQLLKLLKPYQEPQ